MQTNSETMTTLEAIAGHAVVVPDSLSGWRVIDDGFTTDRSFAAIRAAGVEKARVLPAVQERQAVPGKPSSGRLVVLVDWQALHLTGQRNEPWYAVRVAPGTQRVAAQAADAPEYRKGETIIERNLREEGIDVYMPAFWQEIRTHRGRKLRARRFPLLVGYAFIRRDPGQGFRAVTDIDGIIDLVRVNRTPVAISEDDIRFIMLEMFEREQEYRYRRAQKTEEARFKRRQTLNAELGRHLPKGRGRTVSLRVYADACLNSLPEATRARIMGIVSALDGLEQDNSLDEFRDPV